MSKSLFHKQPDIVPAPLPRDLSTEQLIAYMGATSFEARKLYHGAKLFKAMIDDDDTIWMGIAGAGIAGGMGGMISSLIDAGFVDVICSTGAQVYHDLHFAFKLPVKAIHPFCDDDMLRTHGDTRIYDIGIREKETLEAQDKIIRRFVAACYKELSKDDLPSWAFNRILGKWVRENAPHPEHSFLVRAYEKSVPVFWDSLSNHSIAMNLVRTDMEGLPVRLSAQKDILDSAAISYASSATGFVELGGGGPKNFIQQTGPTISQVLSIDYEGADRGLQVTTAVEKEGSLSSCTFGEAVTWGKYQADDARNLVQIWGEYSLIFPLLAAYVIDTCAPKDSKMICNKIGCFRNKLEAAR